MKMRLLAALVTILAARSSFAGDPDIISQNVFVDVTGTTLRVEIDAHIMMDGEQSLPFYTLAVAPSEVTVNGVPTILEDDEDYPGYIQWLSADDDSEWDVHIVFDETPDCSPASAPYDVCTFEPEEAVLLPSTPGTAWYLINLYDVDPFVGSTSVRAVSDAFVVAGQGSGERVENGDGTTTSTFPLEVATEGLAVVARRVDTVSATFGAGRTVVAGALAGRTDVAQRMVDTAALVVPRVEALYGALPVDTLHIATVSGQFDFGGLGLFSNVLFGDFITTPDFDFMVEQGVAHEISHSWWGGLTSAVDQVAGGFLQEAFAENTAWRVLGGDDDAVRTAGMRMNAVWYMTHVDDDLAILDPDLQDDPGDSLLVTYHKGSVVLRTLEEIVGADAFTTALAAVVARGPKELSVEAVVEEAKSASGHAVDAEVDAWREQWLEQAGYPVLRIATRNGAFVFETDGDFDVRVPIRVVRADGSSEEMSARAGESIQIGAAVVVEVDPRWTMVRSVVPRLAGDVSLDGRVDAMDLIEVALRQGGAVPAARRQEGHYDPLYDLNGNDMIDDDDLAFIAAQIAGGAP